MPTLRFALRCRFTPGPFIGRRPVVPISCRRSRKTRGNPSRKTPPRSDQVLPKPTSLPSLAPAASNLVAWEKAAVGLASGLTVLVTSSGLPVWSGRRVPGVQTDDSLSKA